MERYRAGNSCTPGNSPGIQSYAILWNFGAGPLTRHRYELKESQEAKWVWKLKSIQA